MKKCFATICAICLLLCASGCGNNADSAKIDISSNREAAQEYAESLKQKIDKKHKNCIAEMRAIPSPSGEETAIVATTEGLSEAEFRNVIYDIWCALEDEIVLSSGISATVFLKDGNGNMAAEWRISEHISKDYSESTLCIADSKEWRQVSLDREAEVLVDIG